MDNHLIIDEEGFHQEMERQKERARASWVGEEEAIASIYRELQAEIGPTQFLGYQTLETESTIRAIIKDGKIIQEAEQGTVVELILDRTPFYAESGGQTGDIGKLYADGTEAKVLNTKKEADLHVHITEIRNGRLRVWDAAKCHVDRETRMSSARNHTATHLLHTVLRNILGDHVKQAGSYVSPERLRFDFSHFQQMDRTEVESVEDGVNEKIIENIRVETETKDIRDALKSGVIALFGEKYGENVRVVTVPGVSSELCGGTHCASTGEIGSFVILSEGSVASGIRRIEALTGKTAFHHLRERRRELDDVKVLLRTEKPAERIEKLLQDIKSMEKDIQKLKTSPAKDVITDAINQAYDLNGVKIVSIRQDGLNPNELRLLGDNVRDRLKSGIIVISSVTDGQAALVCMVTNDLQKQFHAGEIMKHISKRAGGKGGGKPDLAQGGTKDIEKLDRTLQTLDQIVRSTSIN
jgi:alanyl-tRNA synthetase